MKRIEAVLRQALASVNEHVQCPELEEVWPDTNVFDLVDSMAVVDLLLESESRLEDETGNYVALASETIFDAGASPLLRWSDWVDYVAQRHAV